MRQFIRNIRLLLKLNLAEVIRDQEILIESFNTLVETTVTIDKKLDGYNSGIYNRRRLPTSQRPEIAPLARAEAQKVEKFLDNVTKVSNTKAEMMQKARLAGRVAATEVVEEAFSKPVLQRKRISRKK